MNSAKATLIEIAAVLVFAVAASIALAQQFAGSAVFGLFVGTVAVSAAVPILLFLRFRKMKKSSHYDLGVLIAFGACTAALILGLFLFLQRGTSPPTHERVLVLSAGALLFTALGFLDAAGHFRAGLERIERDEGVGMRFDRAPWYFSLPVCGFQVGLIWVAAAAPVPWPAAAVAALGLAIALSVGRLLARAPRQT